LGLKPRASSTALYLVADAMPLNMLR